MLDLSIRGGTVVTDTGVFAADLGITNHQIELVAHSGSLPPARRELNAEGLLILPGAIDIHFHVRAPSNPERGTFESETQAAAAGGVTTLLEMPISSPCCARQDILENRKQLGLSEAYCNFGLYGAPGLLDRDEILGMARAGACGFKIFTHGAPPGREAEFLGLCIEGEDQLYMALELIKETGLLTSVHAENERLIRLFDHRIRITGRKDFAAFAESRPPVVEAMSVAQLVTLCEAIDTHVHMAHVSGSMALRILQDGQRRGLKLTGETCPHYLLFTSDDITRLGPFAMIKPPMRTEADQNDLWAALADGSLAAITTDHSPFTLEEKQRGVADIWKSPIGAPGTEALVPFVMGEALKGRISLEQAVRYVSTQPAKLFNLYPNKGVILAGSDADLILYDPLDVGTIDSSRWFTKARSIDRLYHGRARYGAVHTTIVNGRVVFESGKINADNRCGKFVRPGSNMVRNI